MIADRQGEIAASVGALRDLGPGYDQALAEGLVERIGEEIDKRIAAELENRVVAEVDERIVLQLDRYAGCRHMRRRAKKQMRGHLRAERAARTDHVARSTTMLALGSLAAALLVTLIVLKSAAGFGALFLMALIWIVIGIINVVYANFAYTRKNQQ